MVGLVLLGFVGDLKGTYDSYISAKLAEERSKIVLHINEITLARHVQFKVQKDSLMESVAAAEALNGELLAALAIRTRVDTVEVEIPAALTVFDSTATGITRTATLSDTTDMGIQIDIKATAPPVPSPLALQYRIIVPEFRPEVAFIENDEGIFASVSWANQQFSVEAPFFRPTNSQRLPWKLNTGGRVLLNTYVTDVRELLYGAAFVELEYNPGPWSIQVPVGVANQGVFTGVEVEKTLLEWNSLLDMLWPF